MRDRFRAKIWIYVAQFIIFAPLGLLAIFVGIGSWTGSMRDANGELRPEAGPPATIMGTLILLYSSFIAFNIFARAKPLIRCHREGIECLIVGQTDLDGVPLMPSSLRLFFAIVTLQGFRSVRYRIPWEQFQSAEVAGLPMARVLRLNGVVTNLNTGQVGPQISFPQVALANDVHRVAQTLTKFGSNPTTRAHLLPWKDESIVAVTKK
ncbi:MAG TPA: hypothetical protein VGQ99_09700 [Tepidisphaeraceae bacterium]|jgi:hypothetical protein|nr:hypothetical protein [Tepidisphaeraceae bacterium]